jgi:hypothetical protein
VGECDNVVDEPPIPSPAAAWVPGIVRTSLIVLLGTVAVGSALGIWQIVAEGYDETRSDAISTAFLLATACVVILASTERWERPGGRVYAAIGVAGSASGFPLLALVAWLPPGSGGFARFALGLVFLGLMGAHGAAVARAVIPERLAWVRWPALASMAFLTALGLLVVGPLSGRVTELAQAIGVCAVVVVATSVCVACVQRAAS